MSLSLFVGPDSQPDKYRLVRSVGRGGEATLYLAEVNLAGQTEPVVVKVLNSDVTSGDEQFAELSSKWAEQAELLRFINRLGVVGVREHFEGAPEHPRGEAGQHTDRALYLVMNYVEGLDLRDWRAEHAVEGPRGQREALRCLEQIAQVLDVLHSGRATPSRRVVVHGDLSPGNIMVSEEGQATLVDFGLSRIAARHMTARPWFTPGYAAPEIFSGEYSAATDRYAFGAIAFFALTGEDPPPSPEQLRERFAALPLVAAAGEGQREFIMSMFSTEPGDRPAASDWIGALRTLATSVPWTGPVSEPTASGPGTAGVPAGAAPPQGAPVTGPPPVSAPAPPGPPQKAGAAAGAEAGAVPPRPVGGLRGTPQDAGAPVQPGPPVPGPPHTQPPRPAYSGPVPAAPTSGPSTGWNAPTAAYQPPAPPAPPAEDKPRRRSRKPLLIGFAAFGVLCMAGGGFLTYTVLDGLSSLQGDSEQATVSVSGGESTEQADAPSADAPGTEAAEEPTSEPQDSATSSGNTGAPASGESTLLTQMEIVDDDGNYWKPEAGRAQVDGEVYTRALVPGGHCADWDNTECTGWIDYDLGRDWSTFTAVIGVQDTSRSGATTTFIVHVDGEQKVTETLRLGETLEIEVDVRDALRLRVEVQSDDDSIYPVWADPTLTA
ncbi:protein kinase domain-containing protein [Nocardiopsis algeriensis]|uniref:protein kinase domain-containing protein n=1 Tax=Nocardiopsis algeriensis TaxID=1478215 RepID=UPI003B432D44